MNCDTVRKTLGAWLDDKVDGRTRASLEAHCARCDNCRLRREARAKLRSIIRASNGDERLPPTLSAIIDGAKKR